MGALPIRLRQAAAQGAFIESIDQRHDLRVHAELHTQTPSDGVIGCLKVLLEQRCSDHALESDQVLLRQRRRCSAVGVCLFSLFCYILYGDGIQAFLKQWRQLPVVAHKHGTPRSHQR